jgi:hypothetical protein
MKDKSLTGIVIASILATSAVLGFIAADRHKEAQKLNGYAVIRNVNYDAQGNRSYGQRRVVPKALLFEKMPLVYRQCRERTSDERDKLIARDDCDNNYNPPYCREKLQKVLDREVCATYFISNDENGK